ncbi:MAG TPA: hypothetical protein VFP79_14045, partial [Pseudolabrys sp.]|nr:hypothetical protein [Pseudolabrys sp.]
MKPQIRTSTKFVLLAVTAVGLSAVMTVPASAQVFKPRGGQTCDNPSTARDKVKKPDYRCLRKPKEGESFEKWQERQAAANAKLKAPNGKPRRDDVGRIII